VTRGRSALLMLVTVAVTTAMFWALLHQISSVWLDVALRPEVRDALTRSMEDQKKLRRLDPEREVEYRRRFEATQTLLNRIEVIRLNREAMLRRFELALIAVFGVAAILASAIVWVRYRRAQERSRREYLERVSALQESARRHAHEIKGPLTAARLELERFADLARGSATADELLHAQESVSEELERLARFTREFSSFAGLAKPVLRKESLGQLVEEFCSTFAGAWPGMELTDAGSDAVVCADRDMVRQVFVNLCTNSAKAGARRVTFAIYRSTPVTLEVRDDGGGIPQSLRTRVFDPYVTTRRIGEGMGLGLSISRKVMLDHGGDLVLVESSEKGTGFRLVFGSEPCN
jgi:signal transduction histidine kinase